MTIIVTKDGKDARKIDESGVKYEGHLQEYVFNNPNSLPMGSIKEDTRLLVIGREFQTTSGRIDVLAVDGDGDIYIVETKLYKNPDKRQVVAQLLDYGAALWNGCSDVAVFIQKVEATSPGGSLTQRVVDFYELEVGEASVFFDNIAANLQNGNFKFLVLMDHVPNDLRQLIVFLNQRTQFDIYAVEMEFYQIDNLEIVIPRIVGAEVRKGVGEIRTASSPAWNANRFFTETENQLNEDDAVAVRRLYELLQEAADNINWARGQEGNFRPQFQKTAEQGLKNPSPFVVYADGRLSLNFGGKDKGEKSKMLRDEFAAQLRAIRFCEIPNDLDKATIDVPLKEWKPKMDAFMDVVRKVFV